MAGVFGMAIGASLGVEARFHVDLAVARKAIRRQRGEEPFRGGRFFMALRTGSRKMSRIYRRLRVILFANVVGRMAVLATRSLFRSALQEHAMGGFLEGLSGFRMTASTIGRGETRGGMEGRLGLRVAFRAAHSGHSMDRSRKGLLINI